MLETRADESTLALACAGDHSVQLIKSDPRVSSAYLQDFLDEIAGKSSAGALTTAAVLAASRKALLLQQAADHHLAGASLA